MRRISRIDREQPDLSLLQKAARLIRNGEVIAYPTETFYGLGADALNPDAVHRIFEIKQRRRQKPILVLVDRPGRVSEFVRSIPPVARTLMERFWPGPLTLVFQASSKIPALVTAGTGTIGIRVPGDPLVLRLLEVAALPVTATSANRSGAPSPSTAEQVLDSLGSEVALILDAGPTPGGLPSTVVDVTTTPIRVLRRGRIPEEMLLSA